MDFCNLVRDIQIGMLLIDLERPLSIVISTFDLDIDLFLTEFYDARIEYTIWYWYINDSNGQKTDLNKYTIPPNLKLRQLERNHAKFWYITTPHQVRFVLTSANLTYGMVHNCIQSVVMLTVKKSLPASSTDYSNTLNPFFSYYDLILDANLFQSVKDKLIYNIPGKWHGIERWLSMQSDLVIDTNNATGSYLQGRRKKIVVRNYIPPSASKVVTYYNMDRLPENTALIRVDYTSFFHYKLYYTPKCLLVSSNNFSYNHKTNFELGILVYEF